MNEDPIQPHPDTRRLTDENTLLREELTGLLTEVDDLIGTVKPNLLAMYQTKIGAWELRLLKLQFKAARLKRRIELIRAYINRGERPDWNGIEIELELECVEWHIRLQEAVDKVSAAEERMKHLMSPAQNRELRSLYYGLVKQLHPDLHAQLSEDQHRLWNRVQVAYGRGDVDEMRALALLAEKTGPVAPPASSLEGLLRDQETLRQQIEKLLKEIEQVESAPPLTLRDNLTNDEWVDSRRREIEKVCLDLNVRIDELVAHDHKLTRGFDDEQAAGQN